MTNEITFEDIENEILGLVKEDKPLHEMMGDVMRVGKEITDRIGHKDYSSTEQFFEDIKNGSSPVLQVDGAHNSTIINEGEDIIWIGVSRCPILTLFRNLNDEEEKRTLLAKAHEVGRGEGAESFIMGCNIMEQFRQMVISSISINGEYKVNYLKLILKNPKSGARTGRGIAHHKFNWKTLKAIAETHDMTVDDVKDKILETIGDEYECVYAIVVDI